MTARTETTDLGVTQLTLSGNVTLAGDIIAEEGTLQLNGTADVEACLLYTS